MRKLILFLTCCLLTVGMIHGQNNLMEMPRLSPRPSEVTGVSNCNLSLNGTWKFQTTTINKTDIEVPGEWTMQGFDVPEGETAIYTHEFMIPTDWQGQRIKIRFDGVSSYGLVKINGQTIDEHEGGMVPFEMDITKATKSGKNEIRVEVKSNTVSDRLGCVSQYAVHTVGGLIRKVSLYALPEVNIASIDAVTELDQSYKNATLKIATRLANEANATAPTTLEYTLTDANGKKVTSIRVNADSQNQSNTSMKVPGARLWNPEQPYLYTLTTTLLSNDKVLQTNKQRIGLRQIEIKNNVFFVNGKKIKLHGVNRHETHPLRGRSLTPELCRKDAELFREGNCNYIRTSHYPPSEEFLNYCDELGLFVECEAAITWIQHGASPIWKLWNYEDEMYLPYLLRANLDNLAGNRHHPCIIIWSLGNESRWSGLWAQVNNTVKKADPSRPTSFHDQCWAGFNNAGSKADVANYHYPGINGPGACDTMSRPTLFGEYAHLSCYNRTELATDPGVRAAFGKPLMQMYDSMYHHNGCLGGALWSGIDDIFHLADGRILGYGPWGPIDGWRRPKPEYTGMKKAYTPFRLLDYKWSVNNKKRTNEIVLNVENRYDFTDLSQATIEYGAKNGKMSQVKVNMQPRSQGKISLSFPDEGQSELYFRVTDPRGFICAEELLTNNLHPVAEPQEAPSTLKLKETNEALIIEDTRPNKPSKQYLIKKVTGLITQVTVDNKVVLQQGPVFSLVPMSSEDGGKPNVAGETYQNNVYPDKNYPFYTLFAKTISHKTEKDGSIMVNVELAFNEGHTGKVYYHFTANSRVEAGYEVKVATEKELSPRQYGMLMQVPKTLQNLDWERNGEFSVYPETDIARVKGNARLNANNLYEVEAWKKVPQGAWKDDANICGSVDFRSTKSQIKKASLTDDSHNGVYIYSDGTQALRAWLQDGCIQLLVADYNNAGSEPFYGSPFTSDRIKVKNEDVLKGKITFMVDRK